MKYILTDADGVLFDWESEFKDFMDEKGYKRLLNTDHEYSLSKRFVNLNPNQTKDLVHELNTSSRISKLRPYKDSVAGVRCLVDKGYKFICITAMSSHPSAKKYRIENLNNVFGEDAFDHDHMVCIEPFESKHFALQKWEGSGLLWVEDHFRHAEAGYELGLKSVLIDNPINRQYHTDLFPRVSSWMEICNLVEIFENE